MPFRRLIPLFLLIIFVTSLHAQVRRNAVPAEECQPSITGIPTITKVSPSTLIAGTTTMLTLTGTFPGDAVEPGCTYDEDWMLSSLTVDNPAGGVFDGPSDPNVSIAGMVPGSGSSASGTFTLTQITLTVTVAAGATPETDYIQVDCDGCIYTAIAPVQIVVCPLPANVSVNPNVWTAGQSYPVTITGQNFVTTAAAATTNCPVSTVYVQTPTTSPDVTVAVSGISVVSATEITATVEATSAPYTGPPLKGGTPAPAGAIAATVEVIATPPAQSGPAPAVAAKVVALDAPAAPAPNVDVLLPPQIVCAGSWMQCNGKAISVTSGTPTPQTAVVGEQIYLTTTPTDAVLAALPIRLSTTSTSWTAGGTNIGGVNNTYNATGIPTESYPIITTTTDPDLTTYWIDQDPSAALTYEYCIPSQTGGPAYECSTTATATFNVGGPTVTVTPVLSASQEYPDAATGKWIVTAPTTACPVQWLKFGTVTGAAPCPGLPVIPGIAFEANVSDADGGSFFWVQLINSVIYSSTAANGSPNLPATQGPGLDNVYPYSAVDNGGLEAYDGPGLDLVGSDATFSDSFSANMFLMWQPNVNPFIAVPVGYVSWSINGTAKQNTTASPPWSLSSQSTPTAAYWASNDPTGPAPGMPRWTTVLSNIEEAPITPVPADGEQEQQ